MNTSTNIELPGWSVSYPNEGDGYEIVVDDLLQGVEAISALPNIPPPLCGKVLDLYSWRLAEL